MLEVARSLRLRSLLFSLFPRQSESEGRRGGEGEESRELGNTTLGRYVLLLV